MNSSYKEQIFIVLMSSLQADFTVQMYFLKIIHLLWYLGQHKDRVLTVVSWAAQGPCTYCGILGSTRTVYLLWYLGQHKDRVLTVVSWAAQGPCTYCGILGSTRTVYLLWYLGQHEDRVLRLDHILLGAGKPFTRRTQILHLLLHHHVAEVVEGVHVRGVVNEGRVGRMVEGHCDPASTTCVIQGRDCFLVCAYTL